MPIAIAYITVILIWGTTPLAIRWSAAEVDLWLAIAIRMIIGLVLSYLWLRLRGGRMSWDPDAMKLYTVSLLGTVGAMYAVYWSSRYIASGLISVLFGLAPILGGAYALILLAERFFTWRRVLSALIALLGLLFIFRRELDLGNEGWKGVLGILVAVNCYALSAVLVKRLGLTHSALVVNTGSLAMSVLVLIPAWLLSGAQLPQQMDLRSMGAILYLGVFGSFVGFVLYYYILQRLSVGSTMFVTLVTPLIALYLGSSLAGEVVDLYALIGSALVLTGLLVYMWPAAIELFQVLRKRFYVSHPWLT